MSGINLSYKIDNGGGELSYFEDRCIKKPLPFANIIAGEIVNEILDNAFDVVSKKNTSSTNWNDIDNVCQFTKTDVMAQDYICLGVVGDIVEENPKKIHDNKIKSEIKSENVTSVYNAQGLKCGVGDQQDGNKTDCRKDEVVTETSRIVEKKSQLINLVTNSPQIINKFLLTDEKAKTNLDEWEATEEQIVRVVDLDADTVKLEETSSKDVVEENDEEEEEEEEEEEDMMHLPTDDNMDLVDLTAKAFKEEERQILNTQLAKGDQQECPLEQLISRNENNIVEGVTEHSLAEKQSCEEIPEDATKESSFKKKKWHFGKKIWGFLKKSNKHQSTSTSKADKQ